MVGILKTDYIIKNYENRKEDIEERLSELNEIGDMDDKRVFEELCFCLCVPQSSAKRSWATIEELLEKDLLYNGTKEEIREIIRKNGVRFSPQKAERIIRARKQFSKRSLVNPQEDIRIKPFLNRYKGDPIKLRDWLVDNVHGIGYKLGSHFLRNTGYCQDLAILDIHILKNLHRLGLIDSKEPPSTRKQYLEVEEKMKELSEDLDIPMSHLDLVFWSNETGEIFK